MKTVKKLTALVLVLIFVFALAVPVSAAGLLVQNVCAQFPTISQTTGYAKTHVALQRFLQGYGGQCKTYLENAASNGNGGVDGYFGYWSGMALKAYQSARSLGVDGIAGPDTRQQIAMDLAERNVTQGYRRLYINSNWVGILLDDLGSPLSAIYVLSDGNQGEFYSWS